jgi:hypothetical protein
MFIKEKRWRFYLDINSILWDSLWAAQDERSDTVQIIGHPETSFGDFFG